LHLQALKVQYDALKTLAGNTQAQLQSTKAQLQHSEALSLQAQQQILEAESAGKIQQRSAEVAEEQCRKWRWACLLNSIWLLTGGHQTMFLAAASRMPWPFLALEHVLMRLAAAIIGT